MSSSTNSLLSVPSPTIATSSALAPSLLTKNIALAASADIINNIEFRIALGPPHPICVCIRPAKKPNTPPVAIKMISSS